MKTTILIGTLALCALALAGLNLYGALAERDQIDFHRARITRLGTALNLRELGSRSPGEIAGLLRSDLVRMTVAVRPELEELARDAKFQSEALATTEGRAASGRRLALLFGALGGALMSLALALRRARAKGAAAATPVGHATAATAATAAATPVGHVASSAP